jgi:hypothetical protein
MKASIIIGALIIAAAILWSGNADRVADCYSARAAAPVEYAPDGRRYAPLSCE